MVPQKEIDTYASGFGGSQESGKPLVEKPTADFGGQWAQANIGDVFLTHSSTGNAQVAPGTVPIRKANCSNRNVSDISFLQCMPDTYVVSPAEWETGQVYTRNDLEISPIGAVPETWMLAGILFVILGAFVAKRRLIPRLSKQADTEGSTACNSGPRESPILRWRKMIAEFQRSSAEVLRWMACLGILVLIVDLQVRKYEINNESKALQSRYNERNWVGALEALDRIVHLRTGAFCNVLFRDFCATFARIPVEGYADALQEAVTAMARCSSLVSSILLWEMAWRQRR